MQWRIWLSCAKKSAYMHRLCTKYNYTCANINVFHPQVLCTSLTRGPRGPVSLYWSIQFRGSKHRVIYPDCLSQAIDVNEIWKQF